MTDIPKTDRQGEDPISMLVERLRQPILVVSPAVKGLEFSISAQHLIDDARDAADALLSLSQERDRLREALEPFASVAANYDPDEGDGAQIAWDLGFTISDLRRARAALHKDQSQ